VRWSKRRVLEDQYNLEINGDAASTIQGERCLSVIMPAFNEQDTIRQVIEDVLAVPELAELIIIDDCSTDSTAEIAKSLADAHPNITLISNKTNLGKTESIKRGFALTKGEVVIVQDADLEYDPSEISKVIAPIISGRAEIVYGVRFSKHAPLDIAYYLHYLANKGITLFSNILSGQRLSDIQTCYIAFRGDLVRNMIITSRKFGFEVEATAKLSKLKIPIIEIPITYKARTYEAGKKLARTDGFAALWYIFKYNILTRREDSFLNERNGRIEQNVQP
jgi:glycosyltransferase involved in cell wall biosynthesis